MTNNQQLLFSIEKGPCFGTCPEYKVEVWASGKAIYKGVRNVQTLGVLETQISDSLLNVFKNSLSKIDLESLDSSYVNKYLTDFPPVDLCFDVNAKRKCIHVFHENPPLEIKAIIDKVGVMENSIQWGKGNEIPQH
ncbi:MAG: DUF6438 domain-containing protein [Bacteroidota bacterium]